MSGIPCKHTTGATPSKQTAGASESAHLALFYDGEAEYLGGVRRFIEPALTAAEPVVAALPPRRMELLRRELGGAGAEIEFLDMFELGRNPARIIPGVERKLARHDGSRLHYIGEPLWPGRSEEEIREVAKHEALINLAWPEAPIRVLCPYDAGLAPAVLADAERTHPRVVRGGKETSSRAYRGAVVPAGADQALAAAPRDALELGFGLRDLRRLRRLVAARATRAGMSPRRSEDLVVAVNELATNAIRHGVGTGTLRMWTRPARIVCQIEDGGQIRDPLAGRRLPGPNAVGGLGLWTVNQLCDLVEMRSNAQGTIVRVHAALN